MKKILFLFVLVGIVFFSTNCSTFGPRGALYTNITEPGRMTTQTNYQVTPATDYEDIAYVEGTAQGEVILGLIATGDFGYGSAIEDALSKAPGATRLVDIIVDVQVKSFLGVYAVFITKVRGRAIRIK